MQVNKRTDNTSESGFTLVEVMIGMFLIAQVFTAAFGAYFLGMRIVEDAREELRASQIIQSELEALRTKNWADMVDLGASNNWQLFTPKGDFIEEFAKNYYCYIRVSNDPDRKDVIIWVAWINSREELTFRTFSTIFTKNGINDYYYRQL